MGDHKGTFEIEYDDISMKTKLTLTRFGSAFGTLIFDEKIFFNTLLSFTTFWDYKPVNAIHAYSAGVCTGHKFLNLNKFDKNYSKSDIDNGSVLNGGKQPIMFRFLSNKAAELVTKQPVSLKKFNLKKNKPVLNTITFYLDDNNQEIDFNGETLTFTLQLI